MMVLGSNMHSKTRDLIAMVVNRGRGDEDAFKGEVDFTCIVERGGGEESGVGTLRALAEEDRRLRRSESDIYE